jgi:two-component system, OmpR family, phosphate regulon sensor histidine kinase PhoR
LGLSFATKLRLALLWPALAAVLAVGVALAWLLPRRIEHGAARELAATAELLAPLMAERAVSPGADLQEWVRGVARDTELRLTLIRTDGLVLADSVHTSPGAPRLDNHAGRPEVRAALARGCGSAVRRSDTTGIVYAYAACVVRLDGTEPLVFRLARPVRTLDAFAAQFVGAALLAGLAALLATATVSWWLGRDLFSPLARLVAGADRLASGELDHRLEVPAEPELALLAGTLNRLAGRVQEQIAAAQRERDHLHSILASMAEGVLVTDAEGRALLANPAFVRLFAVEGEVRGKLPLELARVPKLHEVVREALAGEASEGEEVVLDRGGGRRHAALSATPLGAGAGAVVVARDVTPFVRLDQVRRDFVANVSHELKTPLAAIRGLAETLRDGAVEDTATATRFLGRLLEQCRRLEATVEDLLTLSRLESPAASKERVAVDVGELARRAAEVIAPVAAERGSRSPSRRRRRSSTATRTPWIGCSSTSSTTPSNTTGPGGGQGRRACRARAGRRDGRRHRHRDRARAPRAYLRAVLSGRPRPRAQRRRHRAGARDRQTRGAAAPGAGRGREPARRRIDLPRAAAPRGSRGGEQPAMTQPLTSPPTLAAVDLGSNSFRMVVAAGGAGGIQRVDALARACAWRRRSGPTAASTPPARSGPWPVSAGSANGSKASRRATCGRWAPTRCGVPATPRRFSSERARRSASRWT